MMQDRTAPQPGATAARLDATVATAAEDVAPAMPWWPDRALLAAGVGGAVAFVGLVDPSRSGIYPTCPSLSLFGVWCPLCGGLRATHALATLDLPAAVAMNPAVPVLALLAVVLVARRAWRRRRGRPVARGLPPRATAWTLAVLMVFGVLRNIPADPFTWLAPG